MDDVEARGEGLRSSTLSAMARNLDMERTGQPSTVLVGWLIDKRKELKGSPNRAQ